MVITYSQRLKDRGSGIICQNFVKGKQIVLDRTFQPCFQIFGERGKAYPNKNYL